MGRIVRYSLPRLYYLATPAFMALDYFGGVNMRVAALSDYPVRVDFRVPEEENRRQTPSSAP